ncbi:hypothetical protein VOLCADRAFT_106806 [Volvox carteri f. nagariensis]|uniref:Uncharacterized protein n=1 Tax=Volvox carteri f. nagariensis TaxID=3068 RepID=D8U9W3_VOLCA|nr:uncharacterized protein VOLCADRAFT_106806 [Volvox carteri f. nagariensis]EFJ43543.1 hypothetical protein VOLCADRAFT_106806 [Volvox carteri f. nagariensis]|eukprot:XP_002955472.1 hypothetical protein VOLCADRAFT_106806 [Volvox carteri f. nagariensis]
MASDFVTSDAFGDFFFLGAVNQPCKQSIAQSSPTSPCGNSTAVFTFPVRRRDSSSNKQLHNVSTVEVNCSLSAPPAADATATLFLTALQDADSDCKQVSDTDDVNASSACRTHDKIGGPPNERGYGRSSSLDTGNTQSNRDQCHADGCVRPANTVSAYEDQDLHLTCMTTRRSGSVGGSGGGAGPHLNNHHHNGWHSTEWWRSFSSSRLNEMATEEPDKRSPEMLRVPYVGGAEPMCTLVHGDKGESQ